MTEDESITIYTIGHSDRSVDDLLALLTRFSITRVVDVRSQPYSRWVPQFNREPLARALNHAGLEYLHMGEALGGRPADPALYDTSTGDERPDYERVAATPAFQDGVARLVELATEATTVVMCSEGDHRHCHRALLLAPALRAHGLCVHHILPDGGVVGHVDAPRQLGLL